MENGRMENRSLNGTIATCTISIVLALISLNITLHRVVKAIEAGSCEVKE